jgi:spermidine/putrescine transport system permease protein
VNRRSPRILLAPTWLTLGTLVLAPLTLILLYSFAKRGTYGGLAPSDQQWAFVKSGGFVQTYLRSVGVDYLRTVARSIWLATATTVLCLVVSFPMAYFIAVVARPRSRPLLVTLVVVPFWTSFVIRTSAWKFILGANGLVNTLLISLGIVDAHHPLSLLYNDTAVLIGLVYGELPYMILPLYASLEKLDRTLLEASRDLGAGAVSTFFRVTVPLAMPGLIAGAVLVFIPSIGQYVVSDILGGSKVDLLGNVVQRQFTSALDMPFGSALAIELTLLVLAMLAAYAIYAKRRGTEVER